MSESIDRERLDGLASDMGSREAVIQITSMYAGKLPGEIETLTGAIADADLGKVADNAHRLKSSTAQLGAPRLAELLIQMEAAAREDDLEEASKLLVEVAAEAEVVRAELQALGP